MRSRDLTIVFAFLNAFSFFFLVNLSKGAFCVTLISTNTRETLYFSVRHFYWINESMLILAIFSFIWRVV